MRPRIHSAKLLKALRLAVPAALMLSVAAVPAPAQAATGPLCYVDMSAGGANNGNSWANAYTDLQDALTDTKCKQVWVAEGHYNPGSNEADSFIIRAGMQVYGGFAGGESTLSQRNPVANVTVLSGDIQGNDDSSNGDGNFINESYAEIVGENNNSVVFFDGTLKDVTSATVLDGFTITAGLANGPDTNNGGAIYCDGSFTGLCSPTLKNLTIIGNRALTYGGGLFNNAFSGGVSSPSLTDVLFEDNFSDGSGGGMLNDANGGTSSPTLSRVTFTQNAANVNGGGISNAAGAGGTANPTLVNVTFDGNSTGFVGGGMSAFANGGGSESIPSLTNVTFYGNTATSLGGAIYAYEGLADTANVNLKNVILWNDDSGANGDEVHVDGTSSANIFFSIVQGGCAAPAVGGTGLFSCGSVLDADPQLGALGDHGGKTPTRLLMVNSAARNAGTNTGCPAKDQRGVKRPQGGTCDIGATESRLKKSTFKSQGANDGWILETTEDSAIGGDLSSTATTLRVGDDALDREYRSILSFNTVSVPDDFFLVSATLKVRHAGVVGVNPTGSLGAIGVDCGPFPFGPSAALEPEDEYDSAYASNAFNIGTAPVSGWYSGSLQPAEFGCITATDLTQMRLASAVVEDNDNGQADYTKLSSGNADASLRPKLMLKYYVP